MNALTLMQPWATLVAIGAKRIETRSWATRYRGPSAIHAARTDGRSLKKDTERAIIVSLRIYHVVRQGRIRCIGDLE